jgi:hypothetical protein
VAKHPFITESIINELSRRFGVALKELLEQKHIYQKVQIKSTGDYFLGLQKKYPEEEYGPLVARIEADFETEPCKLGRQVYYETGIDGKTFRVTILLKNAKMFCPDCKDREPFEAIIYRDLDTLLTEEHLESKSFPIAQVLFLTYECQHCHYHQISLIVYRAGDELSLQGRFPMEEIELPKYIPKHEQHLFRDTLIAMHGGKILAALFYLRTFIEQFARRVTGTTGKETGDVIMERYSATLPANQRNMMPSLREWYGKLSEALHEAREDENLLEAALEAIENHFDIRRVHKIPEGSPAKPASKTN